MYTFSFIFLIVLNVLITQLYGAECTCPPKSPTPSPIFSPPSNFINYCEGLMTDDNRKVRVKPMNKPAYLSSYQDPAFGTKITRITNSSFNYLARTLYNSKQSWNIDESFLILYHTKAAGLPGGSGHYLYNGKTYAYIKPLSLVTRDIEDLFWDTKQKNRFFFVNHESNNQYTGYLMKYDVMTDQKIPLRGFVGRCGGSPPILETISRDSNVMTFRCQSPEYKRFIYTQSTKKVRAINKPLNRRVLGAPTGNKFIDFNRVYGKNLNYLRKLDFDKLEHGVLGISPSGNDVYYQVNFQVNPKGCDGDSAKGIGTLVSYDLQTGKCKNLIGISNGYGYPNSGIHHSALNTRVPGWVAVSSIGYRKDMVYLRNNRLAPVLFSEIILAYADPKNPIVCRVGHHRSTGKQGNTGNFDQYFSEPHPVLSPSGSRILINSNWADSGSVDTYVIELPIHNKIN